MVSYGTLCCSFRCKIETRRNVTISITENAPFLSSNMIGNCFWSAKYPHMEKKPSSYNLPNVIWLSFAGDLVYLPFSLSLAPNVIQLSVGGKKWEEWRKTINKHKLHASVIKNFMK